MSAADLALALVVIGLLLLGMAATAWGTDSRSPFSEDHRA